MTSLPIYLGYKYFRSKKGAFASFTSLMAIAGLSLGVAALVIVLSVMNGFEKELQTRVLGVVPQLIIRSEESLSNYDDLISKFKEKTGCPVIVNTSFNVRGEPIVNTPTDAFNCFMGTELDYLVIGDCILDKSKQDPTLKKDYTKEFELD